MGLFHSCVISVGHTAGERSFPLALQGSVLSGVWTNGPQRMFQNILFFSHHPLFLPLLSSFCLLYTAEETRGLVHAN